MVGVQLLCKQSIFHDKIGTCCCISLNWLLCRGENLNSIHGFETDFFFMIAVFYVSLYLKKKKIDFYMIGQSSRHDHSASIKEG